VKQHLRLKFHLYCNAILLYILLTVAKDLLTSSAAHAHLFALFHATE